MLALLHLIAAINTWVLRLGRQLAAAGLALMVVVILAQVFFRYVLNDALAWPDEAARFLMLWMTGLTAPSAFRWGGFVAIDALPRALPARASSILTLLLLAMSLMVLVAGIRHGYAHTTGFGGRFDSSSLRIPLDWFGGEAVRVKLRYMYASLWVGAILLASVNVELILREIARLAGRGDALPSDDAPPIMLEAE
ncbi:MAG: TRAP transporter small permease subunit [Alphaproteobacteria bacterium]|nr:MAG: TRAP transporter small permease subunit [Alphaproteobacteria bacterium]